MGQLITMLDTGFNPKTKRILIEKPMKSII